MGTVEKTLGVAIAGTGFGQKIHLPVLQQHHRTSPIALYHRDATKAQAIAQQHQIPYALDSFEEMVALPEVQAVAISTPPFLHYSMAQTVLEAGKHLLLEKPVTLTVQEAEAWQRMAELLADGVVGQKRLIKIDWMASSRADASRPWNWYAQRSSGGGVLGAIGSHTFDYIHWLFGPVQRVLANLVTSVAERPDPSSGELKPVDSDDICQIFLELTDGTPVQVCLSSTTYQGRGHWVEVYGDQGTLILGSNHQTDYIHGFQLSYAPAGQPLQPVEIPDRLAFPKAYDDGRMAAVLRIVDGWVQGIDRGQAIAPSLKEGIASQRLMDLAHESSDRGEWVTVSA
jgi:predicted dehydrogenase